MNKNDIFSNLQTSIAKLANQFSEIQLALSAAGWDGVCSEAEYIRRLTDQLTSAKALADVIGGNWCKENRANGRGPCGACAICCKEVEDELALLKTTIKIDRCSKCNGTKEFANLVDGRNEYEVEPCYEPFHRII